MIFIRISNSGRPTVLIVGSWFVVWLLNNRPALHTGRIRLTYPALKVVLKPISWNHQKALFGLKPRPPCGLVGPNHLIPSHLAHFLTNTASHTQPEEKLRTQSQRWAPSPPGLKTLRWDRLGVFSYTKILLILFFFFFLLRAPFGQYGPVAATFNSLFQKTPILSHLAWLNPGKARCGNFRTSFGKTIPFKNAQQQLPAR